jgi:predicted nucleic acid-binding protein
VSAVLIDNNVLLDLMTEDARWFSWSAAALEDAANCFRLVINTVVYAEISVRYSRIEDLEAALPKGVIERGSIAL